MKYLKTILFEPDGDKRFYNNNLFNDKLYSPLIFWKIVRDKLAQKGIRFATIDTFDPLKADKLIFDNFNFLIILTYLKKFDSIRKFKEKSVLYINENPVIQKENWIKKNHDYFSKVLIWNDTMVDNKKYFHYFIPQSSRFLDVPTVPFKKKKLLMLINGYKLAFAKNELYSKRIEAIRFFEKYHPKDFNLYGTGWDKGLHPKFAYYLKDNVFGLGSFIKEFIQGRFGFSSYRGQVADKDKISTVSKYKFAICFENMTKINGYITEKIFDCFKAKCVPIYWGADNIYKYIPSNAFIDFRKFTSYNKLYEYIKSIKEKKYNLIIQNIEKFMKSSNFKKWLPDYFARKIAQNL